MEMLSRIKIESYLVDLKKIFHTNLEHFDQVHCWSDGANALRNILYGWFQRMLKIKRACDRGTFYFEMELMTECDEKYVLDIAFEYEDFKRSYGHHFLKKIYIVVYKKDGIKKNKIHEREVYKKSVLKKAWLYFLEGRRTYRR